MSKSRKFKWNGKTLRKWQLTEIDMRRNRIAEQISIYTTETEYLIKIFPERKLQAQILH